jgi:hypothetical protein
MGMSAFRPAPRQWLGDVSAKLRGWRDENWFCLLHLHDETKVLRYAGFASFLAAIVLFFVDYLEGHWLFIVIAAIPFVVSLFALTLWLIGPSGSIVVDDETSVRLSGVSLPVRYETNGYGSVAVPNSAPVEYVVRSSRFDSWFRSHDFDMVEDPNGLEKAVEFIEEHTNVLEVALRLHGRKSRGNNVRFFNERKTCLGSDLFEEASRLKVYQGTFYHSFLTNNICSLALETDRKVATRPFSGSNHLPIDSGNIFLDIEQSRCGNHIGISTIVFTTVDNYINFYWRQSERAQMSPKLWAPLGSGSCDWQDWVDTSKQHSLKRLLSHAMEREFREESLERGLRDTATVITEMETYALGFFRWLNRGGKPEFVGISRWRAKSDILVPNLNEVSHVPGDGWRAMVRTLPELDAAVSDCLLRANLSVPLWVLLMCLREAIAENPERLAIFLGIEKS